VGCSCQPSPALMTLARMWRASIAAAPEQLWRTMMMSTLSASMLRPVSIRVSPLRTLDSSVAMLMTSAESRLAATSKETRVRVEGS